MAEDVWADEAEWPLKRTRWTRFYFHSRGHRIACMATVPCRPGQMMPSSSTATSTIRRTPCPSLRSQPLRNSGGRTTIGRSNAATTSWSTPASPSLLQPWSVVQFRCTSRPRHPRTTRTSWRSCSMCGPMGMLSGSPMAWSAVAFGTGCRNRPCSNQTGSMRRHRSLEYVPVVRGWPPHQSRDRVERISEVRPQLEHGRINRNGHSDAGRAPDCVSMMPRTRRRSYCQLCPRRAWRPLKPDKQAPSGSGRPSDRRRICELS